MLIKTTIFKKYNYNQIIQSAETIESTIKGVIKIGWVQSAKQITKLQHE